MSTNETTDAAMAEEKSTAAPPPAGQHDREREDARLDVVADISRKRAAALTSFGEGKMTSVGYQYLSATPEGGNYHVSLHFTNIKSLNLVCEDGLWKATITMSTGMTLRMVGDDPTTRQFLRNFLVWQGDNRPIGETNIHISMTYGHGSIVLP